MIGVFFGFSRIFLMDILVFKGLTARRLYKSFGVKGLRFRPTQGEIISTLLLFKKNEEIGKLRDSCRRNFCLCRWAFCALIFSCTSKLMLIKEEGIFLSLYTYVCNKCRLLNKQCG
jgi:hypothetical protein